MKPRLTRRSHLLAISAAFALAMGAAHAQSFKHEGHDRMVVLQSQIQDLKRQGGAEALQQIQQYRSELSQISASLGGDLPCAVGEVEVGSTATRAPAPSPTNCTPTTTNFVNNTPVGVPSGPAVVSSTIVVAGVDPYLWDVDVTTFLRHTFAADIDMTIASPAGTVVTLTTDNGGGNDDVFNGTVWDDSANPGGQVPYTSNNGLVTDHVYANNVLASPLVPEEALAAFVGEDPNGVWTLTISDDTAGDSGTLDSWSIDLTTFPQAPILNPVQSFQNNTSVGIPAGPAVVSSTIDVAGLSAPICQLVARTNMPHTFAADLDVTLMSPAGTIVTLTTDNGGGNDNVFDGTVWDDTANPDGQVPYAFNNGLVTDHQYVNLTLASPLVAEEAMGAFLGQDGNGTWTLTISDDTAGDSGTLTSWQLDFTTCSCASSDLSVTLADAPDPVNAGENLSYTVTATNNGPTDADDVSITLPLPAGTSFVSADGGAGSVCNASSPVTCTWAGPTADGASRVATIVAALPPSATGTLNATATVSSLTTDPNPANNTASATTGVVVSADLSISKTNGTAASVPGTSTVYTIIASNAGPSDAPASTVTDSFPAACVGVSWSCAAAGGGSCTTNGAGNINDAVNLPVGSSVTFSATCPIDPAALGTLANTATVAVAGGVTDPTPANNSATDTDTLNPSADVSITKVAVGVPDPLLLDSAFSYTLTVNNSGPSTASNVVVTDAFPIELNYVSNDCGAVFAAQTLTWTIASLPPAAPVQCNLNVTVAELGEIVNTATFTSDTTDPNTANNASTSTLTGAQAADVAIELTSSAAIGSLNVGDTVLYYVTATNNGPGVAVGLDFTLELSPRVAFVSSTCAAVLSGSTVNWSVATLASGASSTCEITATVETQGEITALASVSTTSVDPDLDNNSAGVTVSTFIPIPTLGNLALLMLLLLSALAGMLALRRHHLVH